MKAGCFGFVKVTGLGLLVTIFVVLTAILFFASSYTKGLGQDASSRYLLFVSSACLLLGVSIFSYQLINLAGRLLGILFKRNQRCLYVVFALYIVIGIVFHQLWPDGYIVWCAFVLPLYVFVILKPLMMKKAGVKPPEKVLMLPAGE